jgi:predicted DNA-binding transcriptional regulator YafY
MSTNKNAQLRYRTLDRCFRDTTRKYNFEELLEEVNQVLSLDDPKTSGVETRQLRKDLNHFRKASGFDAPLETIRDGSFYYYTYSNKEFSIGKQPLKENEAEQLKGALEMLSRFEGVPHFEWLSEMTSMLSQKFNLTKQSKKVMGFESNIDYSGYHFIAPIFNATVNERVLEIEYQPFGEEIKCIEFHPYYLKQYNNRWFVFGFNADAPEDMQHVADIWNLALDRVVSIKETSKKYRENEMDWEEEFFSKIIGVSRREGDVQEVVLRFTKEQAPYIETKPLHRSQLPSIENEDGSLTVRLPVVPNYELEQVILSFGEKVRVEAPESLRERIKKRLTDAMKNY